MVDLIAQTEDTAPNVTDIFYTVRDPAGSPLDRKVTIQTLQNTLEIVAKTASATSVLTDNAKLITMDLTGTANSYTLQPNATIAHPIGTAIIVQQIGTGVTSITGGTGVTIQGAGQSVSAGSCAISNRYDLATCIKVATDTWVVQGSVGAIA